MKPLAITASTLTTALGAGNAVTLDALQQQRTGLAPVRFMDVPLPTWTGEVDGVDDIAIPSDVSEFDCRNNRLAWLGLQQDGFLEAVAAARTRWGARRVGVFLGTSTSGLLQTELAYRHRDAGGALPADFRYGPTQNTFSVADFVARALQLDGPAWVVSTACSSSAKVFGNAARLIEAGLIDAALVGGVDSLCLTTLYGFNSLELLSTEICRPWDGARNGLSIGEAAAFALLERAPSSPPQGWLLGVGESNDGYHMSTPHPQGLGAIAAMRAALADAALQPADIDYINLHGTATPSNDAAEDAAVASVFCAATPCSSTKGATGHTLGAAGGVEAAIALLAMRHGLMPAGLNLQQRDPALRMHYLLENRHAPVRRVLSNSFGFGGSNASLVLGPRNERVEGVGARDRAAGAGVGLLGRIARRAAGPPTARQRTDRVACARAPAARRTPPRRRSREARARGRRRSRRAGAGRPRDARDRVHVEQRRRHELPRAVRDARHARADGFANALHELGAQRGLGLLAHRGRQPRVVDQPVRVRRQLRRRPARSRDQRRAGRRADAAGGERFALPRTAARDAAAARSLRRCAAALGRGRRALGAALTIDTVDPEHAASVCADAALEALRRAIPAAAALPLLTALAQREGRHSVVLDYLDRMRLEVEIL